MRFTLIAVSLLVVALLTVFSLLLFRISEKEKPPVTPMVSPSTEPAKPVLEATTSITTEAVSQDSTTPERPLGTDTGMEYPIPD